MVEKEQILPQYFVKIQALRSSKKEYSVLTALLNPIHWSSFLTNRNLSSTAEKLNPCLRKWSLFRPFYLVTIKLCCQILILAPTLRVLPKNLYKLEN